MELTKEQLDAIREYHLTLVMREEVLESSGQHGGQHRQGWQSVEETLNILGIKIEGVNA